MTNCCYYEITLTCDIVTELELFIDFDIFKKFREVSMDHVLPMRHANSGRLLLRIPIVENPQPFSQLALHQRSWDNSVETQ